MINSSARSVKLVTRRRPICLSNPTSRQERYRLKKFRTHDKSSPYRTPSDFPPGWLFCLSTACSTYVQCARAFNDLHGQKMYRMLISCISCGEWVVMAALPINVMSVLLSNNAASNFNLDGRPADNNVNQKDSILEVDFLQSGSR
jgi:hypothetical protein